MLCLRLAMFLCTSVVSLLLKTITSKSPFGIFRPLKLMLVLRQIGSGNSTVTEIREFTLSYANATALPYFSSSTSFKSNMAMLKSCEMAIDYFEFMYKLCEFSLLTLIASVSCWNTQLLPNSSRGSIWRSVAAPAQQTTVFAGRINRERRASMGPAVNVLKNGLPAMWLVPIITDILYWPAVRTVNLTLAIFALFGSLSEPNSLKITTWEMTH